MILLFICLYIVTSNRCFKKNLPQFDLIRIEDSSLIEYSFK